MRRVDGSIGRFLCALLTVVRRVTDPVRPLSAEPRRILVIKLAEQGATVVAHPALADAAALVGADNVFVMVFAENRFILDELEVVPQTNVITIRTDGVAHLARDLWAAVVTAGSGSTRRSTSTRSHGCRRCWPTCREPDEDPGCTRSTAKARIGATS